MQKKNQKRFTNPKIIIHVNSIERLLNNDETYLFWLNIFYRIMPHVDVLYEQLQKKRADANYIKRATRSFKNFIRNIRENIDQIVKQGKLLTEGLPAIEVYDLIMQTSTDRFEHVEHLDIALFFSPYLFDKCSLIVPDAALNTLARACADIVQLEKLETELSIIYTRPDFKNLKGATAFLYMF